MLQRPPTWIGWLAIALSAYPISIALGVLRVDPDNVNAPMWMLGLIGFILVIVGAMVLFGHHTRLNDALASLVLFAMAACGAWIAFYAPAEGFSGGLPFVGYETNAKIARGMFGGGAILTASVGIYAARRAAGRSTRDSG